MAGTSGIRAGLSSVTRGTLVLFVATLVYIIENFVARVILVRGLSTSEWSLFSLALAIASLLTALGTLGLPSAVARGIAYASTDAERRAIVRVTFTAGLLAAFAASIVLFVFGDWLGAAFGDPLYGQTLEYFSLAVGFSILSGLIVSLFQGYEDVRPNAFFAQVLNPAIFVAFLVGSVVLTPGGRLTYPDALLGYVVSSGLALVATVLYAQVRLPKLLPSGPRAERIASKLFRFAAPLYIAGILSTVTGSADTLLLGYFHGTSLVGTYTASLTLARLLQVGVGALGYIFLPVMTKFLRNDDRASIQLAYVTVTKWVVLASLPLFLLFVFMPSQSLGLVYGAQYTSITLPLQITVTGSFIAAAVGPSTSAQVAFGRTRLLLYNAAASAASDVLLSVLLIPTYGTVGAAVAWSVSNAVYPVLSLVELALVDEVHPFRRHYLAPLVITAVPVAVVFRLVAVRTPYWALPVVGIAVATLFILVVLATRSVDRGDRLLLEAVEGLFGRPLRFVRRLGAYALRAG